MDLTVTQWAEVKSVIIKAAPAKLISGRPRQDDQQILNGILWICRTGANLHLEAIILTISHKIFDRIPY